MSLYCATLKKKQCWIVITVEVTECSSGFHHKGEWLFVGGVTGVTFTDFVHLVFESWTERMSNLT